MQRETYNISEFNKLLVEEITVGSIVTTYKAICDAEDYLLGAESLPVWSILKIIEDSSISGTVSTEFFRPETDWKMNSNKAFKWSDRANLSYI